MSQHDAIVIGAGVIGACVANGLAAKGWRTLSLDKAPAAGYGSTGASCAIIRTHYSTLDGAALAHEGYYYWRDWPGYIGAADERGLAEFRETGCLVMKTEANRYLEPICRNMDALGIPYEHWDEAKILERFPFYDLARFGPPRRADDPAFGEPSGGRVPGAVFFPRAGYITDPQLSAHNAQVSAEAKGAAFRFNARVAEILKSGGRVAGVRLEDGTTLEAPVVVNVAGPHSGIVNRLAGVEAGMNIKTRALKVEVAHVPPPAG
ncbi:MAG TPA: FAD-dependent oxidoreductase, partial [Alphaproteobacteria bacterium]|nr:FAD-dependent oxidoreductase [Alphaproteobacteria bacterium]